MTQSDAFDVYLSGQNLFLTGPGGTGKSKWIRDVFLDCKRKRRHIQVCALTGCAALLLECEAKTLHSWAGIGLGGKDALQKVMSNRYVRERWQKCQTLIVDEVSMLAVGLFETLDDIGKAVRKSPLPFGGIQVIFSGDFFQLPPIDPGFCFQSSRWQVTFPVTIVLSQIFRQSDPVYCKILTDLRHGKVTKSSLDILNAHVRLGDGITKLVPTRMMAQGINSSAYAALSTSHEVVYTMDTHLGKFTKEKASHEVTYLRTHVLAEELLHLKIGCHVMCVANLSELVVNGSQGVVVRFHAGFPVVQFTHGEVVVGPHSWESELLPGVGVSQVPLIYAWAITIHKAQGASLDSAEIDAGSGVFECGQTYVALSRVRSLQGLFLSSFNVQKIKLNKSVVDFYANL